jgi:eukaryotic-like serine/threonine-protein kinase
MARESLSGRKLGNYDVGPLVGSGGMGEVYRGRDTSLNRDVAIKVLLPAVAADQERLARFNREAQVLASLNHPNIAHIHGLEVGESGPFLVMEFVEGPTLADRIAQGRIPLDEALAMARQIADALESAHERGIIHRDLKPANIKVSDDGAVKVLDFGLAKAIDQGPGIGEQGSGERANSPTITTPAMTQAGLILGTAAYMSPEQAKGRVVDKRSDVWAFGCVLFEMITGKRAFDGEDVTDTIAAVVRGEPNWSALAPDVPSQIRLLLKRCLEKDRRARISDIGVARFLMNETLDSSPVQTTAGVVRAPRRRAAGALATGLVFGAAVVAAGWWLSSRSPLPATQPIRFVLAPPAAQPLLLQGNDRDLVVAPDGSFVVYRSGDALQMQSQLMIRSLNELEPRPLPGTVNARNPFLSSDGRWVGFFVGSELRKVATVGGSPELIASLSGTARGASWGDDDFIVFATSDGAGLRRVAARGGEARSLTAPDTAKREMQVYPHVLPGSKSVLFTSYSGSDFLSARVDAVEVVTGKRKTVLEGGADPHYASGYLVYATANASTDAQSRFRASLRAVRFDASRVEVLGDSATVVEPVTMGITGAANYSVSPRGDLVFVPGGLATAASQRRNLVWVDRKGRETTIPAPPRSYALGRIDPEGTRIALDIRDQTNDVWIWDISRQTLTPLNRDPAQDMSPLWTPDGKRVLFASTRGGGNPNLYWQAADGTGAAERLTNAQRNQFPTSISPDGNTVVLFGAAGPATDIFSVDLRESGGPQKPLVSTPAYDFGGEISPDGKWLAYHSNESGEPQVYVRPFPNVQDRRWPISTTGGTRAAWARSGRELFYLDKDGLLTVVAVQQTPQGTFSAGAPAKVLNAKYHLGTSVLGLDLRAYDVSPDGQRFLMIKDDAERSGASQLPSMVVVLDWLKELKARLPTP